MTESVSLKVDLSDQLKRPSLPSFDGPLLEEKNGRRDGHGTRSTGAVKPWRRQRAAALTSSSSLRRINEGADDEIGVGAALGVLGVYPDGSSGEMAVVGAFRKTPTIYRLFNYNVLTDNLPPVPKPSPVIPSVLQNSLTAIHDSCYQCQVMSACL
ncbi:hypothetical protein DFH07DRAFT_774083 [Mycena maculata]|uniref:Uncharacterized protein n=1 Tax=Mycena maculata TaxID=230809 RepID=A0AAD7J2T2_9AGAR|nr:hypothetical protein DFH07DRAFT_774083 [Mycena maculata]